MDPVVLGVLSDYEKRAQEEWRVMASLPEAEVMARIDEFLIFVGPDTGKLMHMLAISSPAKVIIEIGASYGYSTVWLADAARATGGKVHSLELSQPKVEHARAQVKRAGLDAYVEFHVGDARETLARLPGPFDFVLLDLWKDLYIPCFELAHPKLAQGAFVVADNMIFPPSSNAQARAYQEVVHKQRDLDSVLLPIGSGVELSRKVARA
jgi:predicted O-methyltransferase YrrM